MSCIHNYIVITHYGCVNHLQLLTKALTGQIRLLVRGGLMTANVWFGSHNGTKHEGKTDLGIVQYLKGFRLIA